MKLKRLELYGFKSFSKKTELLFDSPITAIVGPNGSGKSNVAEGFRWVLGEQSLKSLRGKRGEDLIFNGGNLSGRLNRAVVSVIFDNANRELDIDFDEVKISRTVHRDGTNEYAINDSSVRLKDIIELLSSVSLGPSGHHIISQGEADRILNATIKERREMIEEALGLKVYHWKISESEKKLAKTEDNISQVESLRREIAPHIKFLKKQVEKIEQADQFRRELKKLYLEYFKREFSYITSSQKKLSEEKKEPSRQLSEVLEKLPKLSGVLNSPDGEAEGVRSEIQTSEGKLRELAGKKDDLSRRLGRLEGMIEVQSAQANSSEEEGAVPVSEMHNLQKMVDSPDEPVVLLQKIKDYIGGLIQSYGKKNNEIASKVEDLTNEKIGLLKEIQALEAEEVSHQEKLAKLKTELDEKREESRGAERELFELKAQKSQLESKLFNISSKLERLEILLKELKQELAEGAVLVDREVLNYEQFEVEPEENERAAQEDRRKQIERIKIRLEDMGIDRTDVMEEYKEATERDTFLANELTDLAKSQESLSAIIKDLQEKLTLEFKEGINKINNQFSDFFALMFGGGSASLKVVSVKPKKKRSLLAELDVDETAYAESYGEPTEEEEGIDIAVNLPRKKIKGLEMLSGGERALTSIALLFAMSQVNPPPFLILDETDAALDEANSRKYGDMIENLSKHSQLILITHNRETMSRAGVLYGVTMGNDGISKLLSIKMDEAESYAK